MTGSALPSSKSSADTAASRRGRLVVISGPSGVGKNTIVRGLAARRPFHFSVSATTRPARPGETDGVEYHFLDEEGFSALVREGRMLEWAEFAGNRYGTPKDQVTERLEAGEDVVLDIEVNGALQVMEAYPDAVSIFVMPPSFEELEARMRGRMDMSEEQIAMRLALAEQQMEEGRRRFRHRVVNEDLDAVVSVIADILEESGPSAGRCRPAEESSRR